MNNYGTKYVPFSFEARLFKLIVDNRYVVEIFHFILGERNASKKGKDPVWMISR